MHLMKQLLVALGLLAMTTSGMAGPPKQIDVPIMVEGEAIVFMWQVRGKYLPDKGPRDWAKGKLRFESLQWGRTTVSTNWAGGETIAFPQGQIGCLSITAYRSLPNWTVEPVWQYRWGTPSRLHANWSKQKLGFEPAYC